MLSNEWQNKIITSKLFRYAVLSIIRTLYFEVCSMINIEKQRVFHIIY